MKPWLALFLSAAMCLSLTACGGSSTLDAEKENSENSSAPHLEIESETETSEPSGQEETSSEPVSQEETSKEPAIPAFMQRWYDRLKGTWFAVDKEGLVCESFTIDSAKNITINNKIYRLTLTTQESWGWASIDVLQEDGSKAYDMRIDLRDGGWSTMSFVFQNKNGTYYREDQVEEVKLTKENWLEYFEPGEYIGIGLNAFKEYERMFVQLQYRLKGKYNHLIPEISEGAIECSVKYTERNIEMLPSEKRYVWGAESEQSTPYTNKGVQTIAQITVDEKDGNYIPGFGFVYGSFGLYDLEEDFVGQERCPSLEEVHRLSGTLYFYNGNE